MTKNHFIDDLSEQVYHGLDSLSSSQLKEFATKSPLQYSYYKVKPKTEPSESMKLGTCVHSLLLTPDKTEEEIVIEPLGNKRTKAFKEELFEFYNLNRHKTIVTQKTFDEAFEISKVVLKHDEAHKLLTGEGVSERTFIYTPPICNIEMRCRPDRIQGDTMVELKTTRDASPNGFGKVIANYNYHLQLVHYLIGIEIVTGKWLTPTYIAVETHPPYEVGVYKVSDRLINTGMEIWKEAVARLECCNNADHWPGYNNNEISEIDLPNWAVVETEDNDE